MTHLGLNKLSEKEVRRVMFALLRIVKQLHDRNIKHGNINLDTVMTKKVEKRLEVRLNDF